MTHRRLVRRLACAGTETGFLGPRGERPVAAGTVARSIGRPFYDETSSMAQKSLVKLAALIGEASDLVVVPVMYS